MVKKKTGGGKRYKAVANAKAQGLSEPKWEGPAPPIHVQKKLTRKVQFLEKVSKNASSLRSTKSGGVGKKSARKKPLPDLSTLGAVLDEFSNPGAGEGRQGAGGQKKQRGAAVNTAKQRHCILVEESQRLQQVLQHPLYKKDPIAAISNHLQHTLPPQVPNQGGGAQGKAKGKGKAKVKGNGSTGARKAA